MKRSPLVPLLVAIVPSSAVLRMLAIAPLGQVGRTRAGWMAAAGALVAAVLLLAGGGRG